MNIRNAGMALSLLAGVAVVTVAQESSPVFGRWVLLGAEPAPEQSVMLKETPEGVRVDNTGMVGPPSGSYLWTTTEPASGSLRAERQGSSISLSTEAPLNQSGPVAVIRFELAIDATGKLQVVSEGHTREGVRIRSTDIFVRR